MENRDEIRERLADRVIAEMNALNFTQQQIAEKLGVNQPRINCLLHKRLHFFSIECLIGFLEKLGLTVEINVKDSDDHQQI